MTGRPGHARRVLLDLTRQLEEPRPSAARRVAAHLLDDVHVDGTRLEPAAMVDGRWLTVSRAHASVVLASSFLGVPGWAGTGSEAGVAALSRALVDAWRQQALREVTVDEVAERVDGYLLPGLVTTPAVLDGARRARAAGVPTMLVHHDSLSLLHPGLVDPGQLVPLNDYAVLAVDLDHVAFLSRAAQEEFERHVRRSPVPHAVVAPLGVTTDEMPDVPGPVPPERLHVVCLGAVEPRTRTDVVVRAVERLRAEGTPVRLTLVGREPVGAAWFADPLRRAAEDGVLEWLPTLDDTAVVRLLAGATALLCLGEHEGYGLPALEALAAGTPVVTSASLPALDGLGDGGQLRLGTVDEDTVLGALRRLADPVAAAALREGAAGVAVPSWDGFAAAMTRFVADAVGGARP